MFFSIVIPVNNNHIYLNNFLRTVKKQTFTDFEIIVIDSIHKRYKSAAEAFSTIEHKINGEFIIFAHQDINFMEDDFLEKLKIQCEKTIFGIAGLAGKTKIMGKYDIVTQILHTSNMTAAGTVNNFTEPIETENLDECFIIIPKKIYKYSKFEYFADTWHLYATEYCLQMKNKGEKCYILPMSIWHNCKENSLNRDYYMSIMALCKKYKKNRFITTLYGIWPTNSLLCYIKCYYRIKCLMETK